MNETHMKQDINKPINYVVIGPTSRRFKDGDNLFLFTLLSITFLVSFK